MFVDIVGILLTIIIISPRYWFFVLSICLFELIFTILISMALELSISKVIAGGIFTSINQSNSKYFFQMISPLFFLVLGFAIHTNKNVKWSDLINPFANLSSPLSILIIKTSIFRIITLTLTQMIK